MTRHLRIIVALVLTVLTSSSLGAPARAQEPTESLEVILAIDASGSMRPAIEAAKIAASEFVAAMPPDVRIGLETFADEVTVLAPPTTDRALLAAQIDSIVPDGDTALYDVIVGAGARFTPSVEHKVLVVLSDGKDEGSSATLDDAIAAAQGISIETISLTTAETDLASLTALGPVTSADDAAAMSSAFARVASLLVEVIDSVPSSTAPATTVPAPASTTPSVVAPPTTTAVVVTTSPETSTSSTSSAWLIVGTVGLFAGLFLLTLLLFPGERVSKARLGIDKPRSMSDIGTRSVSAIEEALDRYGKRADLGNALAVADISTKPAEFVATVAVVAVVGGLVGLVLAGPIVGVLVAIAVCVAVRFYVRRAEAKRQAAFADQLSDVLQLVTTALRSGFGLTQALESVAEDAEEPARSEFAHVLAEVRLGRDLSDSMNTLARRMGSKDLEWVVSAIDINRDTGGNLSEILDRVSATIRERGRIARQVRTLTAEGRLSARILLALPFLMLAWQWRSNPDGFELLTYGVGLVALVIAGILMAIGALWVNRIVNSVAL
jgi:Flp pilus assembly protein TadB